MRAAVVAERAGIPAVSIVCEGFAGQARATGCGLGVAEPPVAVIPGHVDAMTWSDLRDAFLAGTFEEIVDALTLTPSDALQLQTTEPAPTDPVVSGDFDSIQAEFIRRGWSDGLPVVPPTVQRVEAMVAGGGFEPGHVLASAPTTGREVTVWSIAVNAVMAGCRPAHFPVVLAIAEALADPSYGVEHSGNTTGADALVVLDSARAADLDFTSGAGALRDGSLGNTTVGRWLRLFLRNVYGFTTDQHDKATFGNTFRVVLTEDLATLDEIGWPTVSADLGHDGDAISIARYNSGAIVGSVFGSTPEQIVPYLGDGLARISGWDLTHVYGLGRGHYRPLLVLSPILARTIAAHGWSKTKLREALFEHARIPAWRFEKLIGEWSNLTAGRRSLTDLVAKGHVPPVFAESTDPDRLVPIVTEPAKILIAVAGDPTRTNAYVFSHDGPHGDAIAKAIRFPPSTDTREYLA